MPTHPSAQVNDLGFALISVFSPSEDHPLQEVLQHLSAQGEVQRVPLHTQVRIWTTCLLSPLAPADALVLRLKLETAHALLGNRAQAQHALGHLLHEISDEQPSPMREVQRYAALLLGLLEHHASQYDRSSQHLLLALTSLLQEDAPPARERIILPVLVWYLAAALIQLHRYQHAHCLLTDVLETLPPQEYQRHGPSIAELYAQRGVVLAHLRFPSRGVHDLTTAIRLDPGNGRLSHVRGLIHMQRKAWTAAYHDLWRALHDDPDNHVLADELAFVLSQCANQEALSYPHVSLPE